MDDNITVESMVEQLGGTPPVTEAEPATDPVVVETGETAEPSETTEPKTETGTESETKAVEKPKAPPVDNTAQQAFVHMRQQNKKMTDTLKGVAEVLGLENLDLKDDSQIISALEQKILTNQAAKQNVPEELLTRLKDLEARDQHYKAEQYQQSAALGFQALQNKFGLEQTDLNAFAKELVSKGMNPLEKDVDMLQEYLILHQEEITAKAVEKAVAEEQARAAKATSQGTTPGRQQGSGASGGTGKVSNVHDLENWLRNQSQK